MRPLDIQTLAFEQSADGLLPAIIQDVQTQKVLMLGYVNRAALAQTVAEKVVTFFSRSKNRLWTKGETSQNFLHLHSISMDCDADTVLLKVRPVGAVCHTGADTCFEEKNVGSSGDFLTYLEQIIQMRKAENPETSKSYTTSLFAKGINKIAQKVGEEAVELVIEAKDDDTELFLGEAADLMFHYLVLLAAKNQSLDDVVTVLKQRHG
jgi:phosphoribosyl-AMP cyclohydrolase / phosphoribosyl-ATP pyrophosphohydrolase